MYSYIAPRVGLRLFGALRHRGAMPKFLGGLNPSFHFLSPSPPLPFFRLEVRPLNTARVWGSAVSSPSGGWARVTAESEFGAF